MNIRFFLTGVLFHLATSIYAQGDFSATWVLHNKQHIAGPQYANSVPKQLTISKQGDSLVIETVSTGGGGKEAVNRQVLALNGQPSVISGFGNRKLIKSLKWSVEKDQYLLTTVYYRTEDPNAVDFTREETFTLSKDGTQLTLDKKSIETRSEDWQTKGVYKKL